MARRPELDDAFARLRDPDPAVRDEAWAAILAFMRGRAHNAMSRRDRNRLDSTDVALSVAGDILKRDVHLSQIEGDPEAYIGAAVRHKLIDHARREQRRREKNDEPAHRPANDPGPKTRILDAERRDENHQKCRRALDALDDADRQILTLRARGLSDHAIAEKLGLSPEAVRQRRSRAARRFRED